HPVTEMITGIDLVKEQIRIASGKPISFKQAELEIKGHAVELRVYAEDPRNSFLPDIGKLQTYKIPQGPGVRVDDGFEQGMEIPIYYDPMIAKLITYGENRNEAIARMVRAVDEYQISGIETTLQFGKFVMQHEAFVSGNFDTHFVEKYFRPEVLEEECEQEAMVAAVLAAKMFAKKQSKVSQSPVHVGSSWQKNRKEY
ncbi:MAG TPA: biotin carboxylase, partial [Sphingobacteriaceae bacterium]